MDHKTLKALKASIAHWEHNAEVDDLSNARIGRSDCALCDLFNHTKVEYGTQCYGCPVYESTNDKFCRDTPFVGASMAFDL